MNKKKLRFLSLEVSMTLHIHANKYVPFKSGICDNCRKRGFKRITDKLESEGFPPVLQDASNEFIFSVSDASGTSGSIITDISDMSITSGDNVANDPDYTLPEEKIFEENRTVNGGEAIGFDHHIQFRNNVVAVLACC